MRFWIFRPFVAFRGRDELCSSKLTNFSGQTFSLWKLRKYNCFLVRSRYLTPDRAFLTVRMDEKKNRTFQCVFVFYSAFFCSTRFYHTNREKNSTVSSSKNNCEC